MEAHAIIRPHDLLWLEREDGLQLDGPRPEWAAGGWLSRAPLVVRRENTEDARLPVGLRGLTRSQRCKGYLERAAVARRTTPEMLAVNADRRRHGQVAALDALAALAPALDASGLAWGPTGGVGFFLASGLPVLRPESDLDLLVRAPQPLSAAQVAQLAVLQAHAVCRIDIQIDTGSAAFALAEWAAGRSRVLLKTGAGPVLSADPWREEVET
ncbi:MAG: malonate decarboxylase holo-ACP synthase [Pseudomonadota bacterium]